MTYHPALIYLLLNMATIIVLAFYSMMEMAAVSFSKVRLQYYASKGIKQAVWLKYLLHNPSRLFGTTLILVNIATVSGSEFMREFYQSMGLNPDLSAIVQVILVVIFGELAPMFAARRYPEHVVMLGIGLVYFSAKLMTPFLYILSVISKACNYLVGGFESDNNFFLNQEELLKILESEEDEKPLNEKQEYDTVATHIFNLHKRQAKDVMNSFEKNNMIASNLNVLQAKNQLKKTSANYLVMYHQNVKDIIGIVYPRDLIRASDNRKIREFIEEPWFVTQSTKVLDLLNQFRSNQKNMAIVIDSRGLCCGIINLDDVIEEIFGEGKDPIVNDKKLKNRLIAERTFPGSFTVAEFKELYGIELDPHLEMTLSELIQERLGSHLTAGEFIYMDPFEISVKETSLTDVRTVSIRTRL